MKRFTLEYHERDKRYRLIMKKPKQGRKVLATLTRDEVRQFAEIYAYIVHVSKNGKREVFE